MIAILILLFTAGFVIGAATDHAENGARVIRAKRIGGVAPKIDGHLDEAIWSQAEYAADFIQKDPNEGTAATEQTKVAFYYDDRALYIGARLYCADPSQIRAQLTRRDNMGNADRIIVSLDTYRDRRTAYSFGVTAAGVRFDFYHASDSELGRDFSFDPVWQAKTAMDEQGWTAEIRIPFSQLRFNAQEQQLWGLNLNRWRPAANEESYWVHIPKNETGWSSRFGDLAGIGGISPSRRLEILPYAANDVALPDDRDRRNPFDDGKNLASRIGADVKMGLGPNLTLEATINPDFGQVEADPAEVNLSAFETFFSERRPFFTEGARLLQGGGPSYFYSRRIGAPPHGSASGDFVEVPDNATIIGAGKVTGRLPSGLSVGALAAVTAREFARTFIDSSDTFGEKRVEPLTGYGVFRLQQEFGQSQSTAGIILTGVRRDLSQGETLAARLNRNAFSGGGDWNLRFQGGKYNLAGHWGFSYIAGDSLSIIGVQRSSAHYFQRPDASHLHLDSSRTALAGYAGSIRFAKNSGRHWLWSFGTEMRSPGFEINDAGRLAIADEIAGFANLTYRENVPRGIWRDYSASFFSDGAWNFGGTRTSASIILNTSITWKNFWSNFIHLHFNPRAQSDRLTRGGPLMGTGYSGDAFIEMASNPSSKVTWHVTPFYAFNELGGWTYSLDGGFSIRPGGRWEFSLSPRYSRSVNPRQYISTLGGGRAETFGKRYVFAFIERSTLSAQLRLNYVFVPGLSLQLYAEPFAASGRYDEHGELLAARRRDLLTYGRNGTMIINDGAGGFTVTGSGAPFTFNNSDFNLLSFRSNFVLRWEWLPGSTLFLVWQQDRSSRELRGELVKPHSLYEAFRETRGDNFLALKVSYWLPVN